MILLRNPRENEIVLESSPDFSSRLILYYCDNKLKFRLESKHKAKVFFITKENMEIYNLFSKFLKEVSSLKPYMDPVDNDEFRCEVGEDWFMSTFLKIFEFSRIDNYSDKYIGAVNVENEFSVKFFTENFGGLTFFEDEEDGVITLRANELSDKSVAAIIKTSDSPIRDFYIPYLRLFESLINSECVKLAKKRPLC